MIILIFLVALPLFLKSQSVEYTSIEQGHILLGLQPTEKKQSERIKRFNLKIRKEPAITYTPILNNSYLPFCWKVGGDTIKTLYMTYGYGSFPERGQIGIKTFELQVKDSLQIIKENQLLKEQLQKLHPEQKDFELALRQRIYSKGFKYNNRVLLPLLDYFEQKANVVNYLDDILLSTSFDFLIKQESQIITLVFYIRTQYGLTLWEYSYPSLGIDSKQSDWKELKTYSQLNFFPEKQDSLNRHLLPSEESTIFSSIPDSSFFKGHFKIIRQKENVFIINQEIGNVYYVGEREISKIGHLQNIGNYPKWLLNRPIFIEDKDKEQLIFLTKLKKSREDLPFPNFIEILNLETAKELFPILFDK